MWSGNAPEQDSDNFGYRSENKEKLQLLIFFIPSLFKEILL
jgi:hypothetical protein